MWVSAGASLWDSRESPAGTWTVLHLFLLFSLHFSNLISDTKNLNSILRSSLLGKEQGFLVHKFPFLIILPISQYFILYILYWAASQNQPVFILENKNWLFMCSLNRVLHVFLLQKPTVRIGEKKKKNFFFYLLRFSDWVNRRKKGWFHMHMETSQKWNENPKEAIRPRGLYTILTKGDTFVVKYQDVGSGLWASRGNKLWAGKYMGETSGR